MLTATIARLRRLGPAALLGAVLALSACTLFSPANGTAPGPTPTPASGGGTPATATATAEPPFKGGLDPVRKAGNPPPPVQLLTGVTVGRHADFDRIVFTFRGGLPGYQVAYVQPPIVQDGSGLPVEVAGSAFLQARLEPASGYDLDANKPVYEGPRELKPGLPALAEVQQTGDFEAVLTWTLGLQGRSAFRVLELQGPARLVIDVRHPPASGR